MARVIAVTNLKGGIGKTTTVVNVSAGLALKGARVLVVDVDAQGNLALALGLSPRHTLYEVIVDGRPAEQCLTIARPNLDLLAADLSLLTAQTDMARKPGWNRILEQVLRPLLPRYDVVLIDCGGSLNVLNVNALACASDILVPTVVEPLSIRGVELLFKQVTRLKGHSGAIRLIVPTMFDPRVRQAHELLQELQTRYGELVAAPVRVNIRLSESQALGKTIYEYDPRSRGAADYAYVVEALSTRIGLQPAARRVVAPATPTHATPVATPASAQYEEPLVTGGGYSLSESCPYCGQPLRQATLAGYRVAFCEACKYKRQSLAHGLRR